MHIDTFKELVARHPLKQKARHNLELQQKLGLELLKKCIAFKRIPRKYKKKHNISTKTFKIQLYDKLISCERSVKHYEDTMKIIIYLNREIQCISFQISARVKKFTVVFRNNEKIDVYYETSIPVIIEKIIETVLKNPFLYFNYGNATLY